MVQAAPARRRSTRSASAPSSASSEPEVLGRAEPRIYTPPLRALTPETTLGFDQIEFARDVLHHPFDPWQEFAVIHAGELLPDGRPRFRKVLVMVARQNGKTTIPVVLSLYWQFVLGYGMTLGTSTKLDYAKESWSRAIKIAEACRDLDELRPSRWTRDANGEQESWTSEGARYKIAAANENAGRSLTVNRLIMDELRQHRTYKAWDAAINTGNAVWDFQAWALSNAGDDRSVVLNDLRQAALDYIATGEGDDTLCLLEWSAPDGADPEDVDALAMANPNLGRRIDPRALLAEARKAKRRGGEVLTGFKTEVMCIHVNEMSPAIEQASWTACREPGSLDALRTRVAVCLDVAPDNAHATLYAAAVQPDSRARIDFVAEWTDMAKLAAELPDLLVRIKPQAFGWLPGGPAAAFAADLSPQPKGTQKKGRLPGVGGMVEIRADTAAVCMGFAEQVASRRLVHSGDPLLDAQVVGAQRLDVGTGGQWLFTRRGAGPCDAVYAAAGAVHLARTLPPPVGKPKLIVVTQN